MDALAQPVTGVVLALRPVTLVPSNGVVFPHESTQFYTAIQNSATTDANGVAVFTGVSLIGPANTSIALQIVGDNCVSDVLFIVLTSQAASLQIVANDQATITCPAPGSTSAYLADPQCHSRSPVYDLGTVPMGTPVTVTLFASDAVGNPFPAVDIVPLVNEVPPYISLDQWNLGVPSVTTVGPNTQWAYGSATGSAPFLTITFPTAGAGSNGVLDASVEIGQGYPGQYAVVFSYGAGALTQILTFDAVSEVESLTIITQPATAVSGTATALVGNRLDVQPVIKVMGAGNTPLQGYRVNA